MGRTPLHLHYHAGLWVVDIETLVDPTDPDDRIAFMKKPRLRTTFLTEKTARHSIRVSTTLDGSRSFGRLNITTASPTHPASQPVCIWCNSILTFLTEFEVNHVATMYDPTDVHALLLAGCTSPGEIDRWTPHGEPLESVKVQDFTSPVARAPIGPILKRRRTPPSSSPSCSPTVSTSAPSSRTT